MWGGWEKPTEGGFPGIPIHRRWTEEEELTEIPEEKLGKHKDDGGPGGAWFLLKGGQSLGTPRRLGWARGVRYRHIDWYAFFKVICSHTFGISSRKPFISSLRPPVTWPNPSSLSTCVGGRHLAGRSQVEQSLTVNNQWWGVAISNNQEPASSQVAGSGQLSSVRRQGRGGGVSPMPGRWGGREHTFTDAAG